MNTKDKQSENEAGRPPEDEGVVPGYATAYATDANGFPVLDRRTVVYRRRTDQDLAVGSVMDRAELLEMTDHLRDYLASAHWDIDPDVRRHAQAALAWMTDRGSAGLIMRLGARSVLTAGWPEVMQDMAARLDALDMEQAERQLQGVSVPMEIGTHSQWLRASHNARLFKAMNRQMDLSSFLETPPDPDISDDTYLPPEEIRHSRPWPTGKKFFF